MSFRAKLASIVLASASASTVSAEPPPEAPVVHGSQLATKKGTAEGDGAPGPIFATLEQVHTGERVILDPFAPTQARFDDLVADRITGERHPLDERLLLLLRALAAAHPGSRIEIVSGFRSPKLNEILRKKGHHVASHSQHSLGHACDFRVVPNGGDPLERGLDPRVVESEIRALGWQGGVGVYPTHDDWFVHADVGRDRHWEN